MIYATQQWVNSGLHAVGKMSRQIVAVSHTLAFSQSLQGKLLLTDMGFKGF